MSIPFPDLDPYRTLSLKSDCSPLDIKKSYRKLCLIHHPDKLINKSEDEKSESKLHFQKISFSYQILNDPKAKKRYDETGSLAPSSLDDEDFSWKEFFQQNKDIQITKELVEKDKLEYQGSIEEEEDVIESFVGNKGNFLKLFEEIPHLEFSDEERMFELVTKLLDDKAIKQTKKWKEYTKSRNKQKKKFAKKMRNEEMEAEELKKELGLGDGMDSLKAMIQKKKTGNGFDSLIFNLEKKYGGKVTKEKKKKNKKKDIHELNDEEFEKLQQKILNK